VDDAYRALRAVRNACKILVRKPKGRDLLGDMDVGGKIIFQRIFKEVQFSCCGHY
jgi:hypothetical protein